MEKYVDCHNCQNQYDCERTYLGGCTDGKEWEQEEKKLTDEQEVIKLLEIFASDNEPDGVDRLAKMALDLIRRLQYGYSSASKASEEWKAKYEAERKENAELQKQLDELKEEKLSAVCDLNMRIVELDNELKQAVKDTAKEILQELWDETEPLNESHKWVRLRIKNIASRKGVEVE